MKRGFSILLATMLLWMVVGASMAETASTTADATSSATQMPGQTGGQTGEAPSLMGLITAIGDNTITITTGGNDQPNGNAPQGGNGQPNGNAPQGGNGQPNGNAPQGGNGQQNGNGQLNRDAKSLTITVTDATTYTLRGSNTTIAFSNLTVGMRVSVQATGDETSGYTATAIEADQSQPADNTATTAADGTAATAVPSAGA